AAGSLAAAAPDFLARQGLAAIPPQRAVYLVTALAVVAFLVSRARTPAVELSAADREAGGAPGAPPPPRIRLLAGLFALDAFGGGFIVQSFLVYWFVVRFGAGTGALGALFAASGLLQAASSVAAGWMADRIGYLKTMLVTHIPSNVLMVVLPFVPSFELAAVVLLLRFSLSQMDVPARQAFVVAMAPGVHRTRATAYTNTARYVTRPFGTALAGASMQALGTAAPLALAGVLKLVYDALLLVSFRGFVGHEAHPEADAAAG
ncbi:MAG: hypothetical protein QOE92_2557, partial [Chloroflexota bacterium]|nr:hypothetical protein [Chloroflexota bacterium]